MRHADPAFREALWARYFIRALGPCLLFFPDERVRGDRDNRDRPQRRIGLNPARGRVAVHDMQLDVHQKSAG